LQAFLAEMNGVVALGAEPLDHTHAHAHVGEESHAVGLRAPHFLASQPGGIFESLLDVLWFEVGVLLKNLGHAGAVRDLAHDYRDRDPHSADAGAVADDLGVERDSIEHGPSLLSLRNESTASTPKRTKPRRHGGFPPQIRAYCFEMIQRPSARCGKPERSKVSIASSGEHTSGSPCRLKDVFSTAPMPVRDSNSRRRR
jgi:hypothetical protein